jgi:hypothetical protein
LIKIRANTLANILSEHLPAGQTIDFLTIDVENHNLAVLKSNDWEKYRPRFILVEADNDGYHSAKLEDILHTEMVNYMRNNRYQLVAWAKPTMIFQVGQ